MIADPVDSWIYLRSYLGPLVAFLARADVTDIYVNRPQEIWVETLGGAIERHDSPQLDTQVIERLVRQIAAFSHQAVSREHPLLSATLPDGARVQAVLPPATRGSVAIAIRKHVAADMTLADLRGASMFDNTIVREGQDDAGETADLHDLLARREFEELLRMAVRRRINILISGGTSTGKTTFLNALLKEIPPAERLVLIEDTPELAITHQNAVGLLAARSQLSEAAVTTDDLVTASLRMRPDRIILGELRGREAFSFLRAVNTGHPGSMTTVHADSPTRAVEQIALLVMQGGSTLSRSDVATYIASTIGVFVQLDRTAGRRVVRQVALAPSATIGGGA